MTPVLIIGGGGHARVTIDIVSGLDYEIAGYVDSVDRGSVLGARYLGNDADVLDPFIAGTPNAIAALGIGIVGRDARRSELFRWLERAGYQLPAIVSKHARIGREVTLGAGVMVGHNAVVQPCARVGKGSILNTGSIVEHDCRVGDFVHIAPGAVLCGAVEVGDGCLVGAGAVVVPYCKIAGGCVVGAGAVVTSDIREPGTFVGVPARRK